MSVLRWTTSLESERYIHVPKEQMCGSPLFISANNLQRQITIQLGSLYRWESEAKNYLANAM